MRILTLAKLMLKPPHDKAWLPQMRQIDLDQPAGSDYNPEVDHYASTLVDAAAGRPAARQTILRGRPRCTL
jgi:hypothetical protein